MLDRVWREPSYICWWERKWGRQYGKQYEVMWKSLSCGQLFATAWTIQAMNSLEFSIMQNSPGRILEWVAFPFSRGSSQRRDRTQVSHIAGGFFTSWGTREAWKTVWRFLKRLELSCDSAIPLLGIYPEKTVIQKDTSTSVNSSTIPNSQDTETI